MIRQMTAAAALIVVAIACCVGCGTYAPETTSTPVVIKPASEARVPEMPEIGKEWPLMKLTSFMKREDLSHSDFYGDYFMREQEHPDGVRLSCIAQPNEDTVAPIQMLEEKYVFVIDDTKVTPTIMIGNEAETVTIRISQSDYDRMKKVERRPEKKYSV